MKTYTKEEFLQFEIKSAMSLVRDALFNYVDYGNFAKQYQEKDPEKSKEYARMSHDALGQYIDMNGWMVFVIAKSL